MRKEKSSQASGGKGKGKRKQTEERKGGRGVGTGDPVAATSNRALTWRHNTRSPPVALRTGCQVHAVVALAVVTPASYFMRGKKKKRENPFAPAGAPIVVSALFSALLCSKRGGVAGGAADDERKRADHLRFGSPAEPLFFRLSPE